MLKPGLYWQAMRKWINGYFNFTKSEFNGVLTLFVLIVLCLTVPRVYFWLRPDEPNLGEIAELKALQLEARDEEPSTKPGDRKTAGAHKKINLHAFDPNTLDQQGWQDFGLSAKQANAIINYRSKGGRFRKAEDLQKMYTIRPELYELLRPYVHISETGAGAGTSGNTRAYSKAPVTRKETVIYELNGLDTTGLQAINGIGPAFARRIFKYRERLGGFAQPEQLLEVFGIDSSRYAGIKPQVRIDESRLRKININTADFETLRQHPYLRYKQVNAILEYRKQHGNYSSFADLKKVAILPEETVDKLAPYISF